MQSNEVYGALVPLVGKEDTVHDKFWDKIRRTIGKVPFTDRAIAAYYAATARELDRVTGGGIVPGAAILLSGEPG